MKEIKDAFMEAIKKASVTLINQTINATSLGIAIVVWVLLSIGASIINYKMGMCNKPKMEAGTYVHSRLFCRVNEIVD